MYEFVKQYNLDSASIKDLVITLITVDVIEYRDNIIIVAGKLLYKVYKRKLFFYWLYLGFGELFAYI